MATVYLAHDLRHDRPVALKVLHPRARRLARPRAVPARDPPRRPAPASPHPDRARLGRGRRPALVHHAVRRGRVAPRPAAARAASSRWTTRSGSPPRPPARSTTPTSTAWCTATSSPRTSCSPGTAARSSPTSASPARSAGDDGLTETGLAIGTPAYMSPEQAAGDQALDARTDLYSLASVLYEMLAGEPPFTGPTAQAIVVKRLTEPAPSVRAVAADRAGRRGRGHPAGAGAGAGGPVRHGRRSSPGRCTRHGTAGTASDVAHRRHDGDALRPTRGRHRAVAAARWRPSPSPPASSSAAGCCSPGGATDAGGEARRRAPASSPCCRSRTWATPPTPTSPTA